jgi:reactive intermediate/imine deaminase
MSESVRLITPHDLPAPGGHYSPAVEAAGFVFVSGQLPLDATGRLPTDQSFEMQVRAALANLFAILRAARCTPADVVKVTAFIVGVERWPQLNEVYAQVFGSHKPARSVVPVPALHHGCLVEIEAVARTRRAVE